MNGKKIFKEIKKHFLKPDDKKRPLEASEALRKLALLFAPQRLDVEQTEELIKAIALDDATEKEILGTNLYAFFAYYLRVNFLSSANEFLELDPVESYTNTFYGYWTVLSHCLEGKNLVPQQEEELQRFCFLLKMTKGYKMNLKYQNLRSANLSYCYLDEADFSYANLSNALLINGSFKEAVFINALLKGAKMEGASFEKADLSYANVQKANLIDADLTKAMLFNTDLESADLSRAKMDEATLDNSNLHKANLTMASLKNAKICQADATRANFSKTNLSGCNLYGSNLFESVFYHTVFTGAKIEGADLRSSQMLKADFRGIALQQGLKKMLKNQGALVDD